MFRKLSRSVSFVETDDVNNEQLKSMHKLP